jgi:hypothetical protein
VTVNEIFKNTLTRFRPNDANAPATPFVFGIITPQYAPFSVAISRDHAALSAGIAQAQYLLYGDADVFTALFDPATQQRRELVQQVLMRPDYPFSTYLISILLRAFDLAVDDLDYEPKRYDGPYPFPPRYPAAENPFRAAGRLAGPLPAYSAAHLPRLVADEHPEWLVMYDRAWQLAFGNLRQPEAESGFVSPFIDAAFNDNTFMWDSCFMTLFGVYGRRLFPFIATLDNFYAKQQDDGFICREINTYSGKSVFQPLDPRSTGPNILAWAEWLHYCHTSDHQRLHSIFPGLVAYHRWWQDWRTHPDGSYWTSGWGSGMDNQTRVPSSEWHHRHHSWVDATMQQALNTEILLAMGAVLGRDEFRPALREEQELLSGYLNRHMWDEARGFYFDRAADGALSQTMSIAGFWGLLGHFLPAGHIRRMVEHLEDESAFKRSHRVPTIAFSTPDYNPFGGYWQGGVWSPTNYMVLCGLATQRLDKLAHAIALNHVTNVAHVFHKTGTLWENYAPETLQPGQPAGREFVGWTGLSAITIPIEFLIGIRPSADAQADLTWDIRLTERHGITNYPFREDGTLDMVCEARPTASSVPQLRLNTDKLLRLRIRWQTGEQHLNLVPGTHYLP